MTAWFSDWTNWLALLALAGGYGFGTWRLGRQMKKEFGEPPPGWFEWVLLPFWPVFWPLAMLLLLLGLPL